MKLNKPLNFEDIEETYIAFIKQNFILIKKLINESQKDSTPYDPVNKTIFLKGRSKHLQTMSLIGLTSENLTKLIVSKRGYVLNKIFFIKSFTKEKLEKIVYESRLIEFRKAVELFNKSNPPNYYSLIKSYVMNPYPDIYDKYSYFNRKIIEPNKCLDLLIEVRNSYLHFANPHSEQNGIIWYLFNFLIWLTKKEFPEEFKKFNFIGSKESKKLFKK